MKKGSINSIIVTSLVAMATIYSCAEGPKKTEAAESMAEDTSEVVVSEKMDEDFSFMLPSPIQIASIFSQAGLKFDGGLTNPASKSSNYNTKTAKYLNFGVYSADLAYSVLNDQQQMSIDYLNVVKAMADDIGMPGIFGSGELIESFQKNIGNQDTMLAILTKVKRRTDEYLLENSEESKEAVFFAGAWIEGMYIGSNAVTSSTHVSARLVEQMTIVNNIIRGLQMQKDESLELDWLITDLTTLNRTFNSFESIKSLDLNEISMEDLKLENNELMELKNQIVAIRTKITAG